MANAVSRDALNILIVDDNADAAHMLSMLLELEGHSTVVAHDGLDALEAASATRFDAILLDLGMPVMDGFQIAAALRELDPAPALIACTAWSDPQTRRRTESLGFRAHLVKPVGLRSLQHALGAVAAGKDTAH
jgi:CheY-like chemotaxis protein